MAVQKRGKRNTALHTHCTENPKLIFTEIKLRGLAPNFYLHVYMSDLYIPTISPPNRKIGGPIMGI